MIPTLMRGLNERDMNAVVNSYELKEFYYPTLFPLRENYTLTWKTLEAQAGLRIAADLVARGASVDKKTREAIARLQGDIPKISVKRVKDDEALNEYDIMLAMTSQNPDLRAIVEFWAEDTNFCWNAVAARIEWLALTQISLGKIPVTADNNVSVITEYEVDYQIPAERKLGTALAWSNPQTAKPISADFKAILKKAKKDGISLKFAFMNSDTFANFAECAEVQRIAASFAQNALNIQQTPSVEQVNTALARLPYLKGLQIVVIDQDITLELADGTRKTGNPFADDVVMFSESKVLGTTFWKKPADANVTGSVSIKAQNGHTLIKKFAVEEPLQEVTMGIANAFPAWVTSQRSWLLDTAHTDWSH